MMVLRCGTRALVVVLAASVGLSALASCLTMPMSTDAEMACCIGGHDDCMPAGQAQTCCKTQPVHDQQLIVSKPQVVPPLALVVPVTVALAFAATPPVACVVLADSSSPPPLRSAPAYLLGSAFLI